MHVSSLSKAFLCALFSVPFLSCASAPEVPVRESLIAPADDTWIVYNGTEGPGVGKRVLLIAGDEEYRSEEAMPQLARILAFRHGFDCAVLFSQTDGVINPDDRRNIPGLELLYEVDMVVLFTRFRELSDEDMERFAAYLDAGKPIFGIRTATHAFHFPKEFATAYRDWRWNGPDGGFGGKVLGETWVSHHGKHGSESTRGVVVSDHPILRGVEDVWGPTDVYGIRALPEDSTVLLEGAVVAGMKPSDVAVDDKRNDPRMPIVWIRERELASETGAEASVQRIVCSTIGASVDLLSEDLRRAFVNAVYWGAGLEGAIPERSNVAIVGEYAPTHFGFGAYTKGIAPASFRLNSPDPGFRK